MLAELSHRSGKALNQGDPRLPPQGCQAAHVKLLLRGAIGFAGVPLDSASVFRGLSHSFRQRADREIHTGAHVQERRILYAGLPVFQSEHAGLA